MLYFLKQNIEIRISLYFLKKISFFMIYKYIKEKCSLFLNTADEIKSLFLHA